MKKKMNTKTRITEPLKILIEKIYAFECDDDDAFAYYYYEEEITCPPIT